MGPYRGGSREAFQTERRVALGLAAALRTMITLRRTAMLRKTAVCLSSSEPKAVRPVVVPIPPRALGPARQLCRPDFIPHPKQENGIGQGSVLVQTNILNKIKMQKCVGKGNMCLSLDDVIKLSICM